MNASPAATEFARAAETGSSPRKGRASPRHVQAIRSRRPRQAGPGQTASRRRDAETSRNGGPTKVTGLGQRAACGIGAAVLVAYGVQLSAVATRYAKRELMYEGTVNVASIRIWLCDPR